MAYTDSLLARISRVRIYCDTDAGLRDQFGRVQHCELKPMHDQLFQMAIDLKLATMLVVLECVKPRKKLRERCTVLLERPRWWPAMRGPKNRSDLLVAPLDSFNRNWGRVRQVAESNPKQGEFWQDDPALAFELSPGVFLCRAASVGHEGIVYYFVYEKELRWEEAIQRSSLRPFGEGESAYRRLVPDPGLLGGK